MSDFDSEDTKYDTEEKMIDKEDKEDREENTSNSNRKSNIIEINGKKRFTIFLTLFMIATISSCDGGIIPQQNDNIKQEFGGDGEERVGLFGSIDYIGRIFGAVIFTIIMGRMNRKMLLIITLIFKSITLVVPLFTYKMDPDTNYLINNIARGLSGISQVFYPTYLPVWCDQYGKKSLKTIWVTLVQIGNPVGIIIGYGLGMFFEKLQLFSMSGWRTSFAFEGIILIVCSIILIFFDNIYFSEKLSLIEDHKGIEVELTLEQKKSNLFTNLFKILCNKLFLFCSICNSVAFFGIGVVQYFGDKYMSEVLQISDSARFILFALLCLFGPTTGMVVGGIITSKLGGYVKKSSMTFVIISMAIASTISMLISIHKIPALFVLTSWTYLFAIGATIPPISGIIISCLDNNLRGDGFSVCNFILNLFGSFPSSYVYSLLADLFSKGENDTDKYRKAWGVSMAYNFFGLLLVIIGGIFRYKIKGDLSETQEEKKEEEKEELKEEEEKNNENPSNIPNEPNEPKEMSVHMTTF